MKLMIKSALIACAALTAVHCTHKEVRQPASVKQIITDGEAQALGELMGGDSPLNPYRHKMSVHFHTNGDQKYLSKTARKALNEALIKTLGSDAPEQGLAKIAGGNIKDALIENFVKTMRFYKIINTGLQVDLMFNPEFNQKNDYSAELNSNQLVRLSETGRLSSKWEQLEKATVTGTVYNNSALVPVTKGAADYIGGSMTIYIEIMDIGIGVPSIKKYGVKGFVRYRRYYRSNHALQKPVVCDGYTLSAKSAGPGVPLFYTVDLYKNFNLKDLIPTEETLEIYPGLLASHNEGRRELMPDTYEETGKSVPTGTFQVEEKRNSSGQVIFNLSKIVYDLKERELDRSRTKVDLVDYNTRFHTENAADGQQALSSASRNYLKKCESSMEKYLNLNSLVQGGVL
nr:hypothetical protein CKG001_31540 [Bdellovibrio sp. CKG001]